MDTVKMEKMLGFVMRMLNSGISDEAIIKAILKDDFIVNNLPWSQIDPDILLFIAQNASVQRVAQRAENEIVRREMSREQTVHIWEKTDKNGWLWEKLAQKLKDMSTTQC